MQEASEHLPSKYKASALETFKTIAWALFVVMGIRTFILEPFKIPSGSMIPSLKIGDFIFVTKFSYGFEAGFRDHRVKLIPFARPERGDIIVFIYPENPKLHYIKRVIGLPGDRVKVMNTVVWINGEPSRLEPMTDMNVLQGHGDVTDLSGSELYTEYLPGMSKGHHVLMDPFNRYAHSSNKYFPEKIVPEDSYFVMGDNRDHSSDSRVWGVVPYKLIKGKAQIVWLSMDPTDPMIDLGFLQIGSIRWSRWFHLLN